MLHTSKHPRPFLLSLPTKRPAWPFLTAWLVGITLLTSDASGASAVAGGAEQPTSNGAPSIAAPSIAAPSVDTPSIDESPGDAERRSADAEDELDESPISDWDRLHWSYQPRRTQPAPSLPRRDARVPLRNAIDVWVERQLQDEGLTLAPGAQRRTLIRRVTFDLLGRPPSPRELHRFLNDAQAGAYERLVDRLLASPEYGIRWAQHWLDVARFAETDGFEHDKLRPEAFRYRDWVVTAFNQDLPYDQFIYQQLAGDLLTTNTTAADSAEVATGFCLAGPDMPDINSQDERRHHLLNGMVSTVGAAFLAMQLECAQCHDHKYDPLSQADFYRFRAVFETSIKLEANQSVAFLQPQATARATHVMLRGDWQRPGAEVSPAPPRVIDVPWPEISVRGDSPAKGWATHPRHRLAEWLTEPTHPLTARVIVNRLWQHHFGIGLSRTPNDFGLMGDEPQHLELLDALATELIRGDWSLKRLQRWILCSSVYRQISRLPNDASPAVRHDWQQRMKRDPDGSLWSRRLRRRLEGEAIRDTMLSVSGRLNSQMGGPGVRPPLPAELKQTLLRGQWDVTGDKAAHQRRSLYLFARRNLRFPFLKTFDRPAANASCGRRNRATTALQSLLLLNSRFAHDTADAWAQRLLQTATDDEARLELAFVTAFGRSPEPAEVRQCEAFLQDGDRGNGTHATNAEGLTEQATPQAWSRLCLALLNTNEFVYVD